jgi:RNA polymerase sigma-70 factor (ECF subfamily)
VVLRWCCFLGGDRIDADEAARDVFFRLWRAAGRIHGPAVFRSFLYSVTRRVVSEHRRRAWLRRWVGEPVVEPIEHRLGPDQEVASREIAHAVQTILDGLRRHDREVLVLCEVQGHTAVEAAELLSISPNTVKSRLRRARERFEIAARCRNLSTLEARNVG